MAKKVKAKVRLQIKAAAANPAPPVGPTLAQYGLNIAEFCKKFNDATKNQVGFKIPVEITVYEDRSYDFKVKQPISTQLIKKVVGIEKGSGEPNKKKIGKITMAQIEEVAKKKLSDLNTDDLESAKKIIAATAKAMGLEIVGK
ncbi:MAG TPA: 50S ribosomal protein L11 [Candidatus Pacearchaeota archaeon]|nr:50S ribosomal protein L11 [Candidatus Pacearchaeota archaeon]